VSIEEGSSLTMTVNPSQGWSSKSESYRRSRIYF